MTEIAEALPPEIEALHVKSFYGQPFGLWVATLTEFWIAVATYGMQALLLFYMQQIIFKPETISHILGAGMLMKIGNFLYHPPSLEAMAGALMGLYLVMIFGLPVLGAYLADYFFGRKPMILAGLIMAASGLLMLASPVLFVFAILIFLLGIGFAGSLKAQVGALYAQTDRRRSDAYQIYSLSIQIAVMFSPLVTSYVAQKSWAFAFILCAVGMTGAIVSYIAGLKYLPADKLSVRSEETALTSIPFTPIEKKRIGLIIALTLLFAISALPNMELQDGYLIWAEKAYNMMILGYDFPVSNLYALDGLISTVTAFIVLWFWQFHDARRKPMSDMGKILIGTFIGSLGPLILAYVSFAYPKPHEVSLWWGVLFHTVNDFGFAMSTMIGVSLVSRLAPERISAIMISFFWLHICLCNLMVGNFSSIIETMEASYFWLLHSGGSFIGLFGLIFIAFFCKTLLPKEV